ncbi:pre-mRNA-splicing factor SLU7-A [Trifolium repens]|nr:pre-mRNA-splicing factor SLU7-A [Trifolium repens]
MGTTGSFKSREDHRKQIELEEARKAGLAPAELDEDGKEINPHIPHYMSSAPWYLNAHQRPSLKHQRKWKSDPNYSKSWYDRGAKVFQASNYRKGACENCGAMTHVAKTCTERSRKVGAKYTNKNIAADEKIETFELDYDGKRDRWNGYDPSTYARVINIYEARDKARNKFLKEQQVKKLEKGDQNVDNDAAIDDEAEDQVDDLRIDDETKVDESKQMDFAKVKKRVRTTDGGSTGTVRNLRIREDTAKYLINVNSSPYYNPKSRSMREDPFPDADPNEKFHMGDNYYRNSGQALEFKELNIYASQVFDKGQDVHLQAAPSQAELLYKNFKARKEKLKSQMKETIFEKYGNAANEDELPRELLLGQSERQVEYDRAGRIIKGQEIAIPRGKYEEDVYINNHTTVWGSWWKDHQWGFKCCKQMIRRSYCTGIAGIDAAEAATDLMTANMARN